MMLSYDYEHQNPPSPKMKIGVVNDAFKRAMIGGDDAASTIPRDAAEAQASSAVAEASGTSPRSHDRVCCGKYYQGNREAVGWAYDAAARGILLIGAVFLSTAVLGLAEQAAGCADLPENKECEGRVYGMKPSSLITIMTTVTGLIGALIMPLLGAIVDHTPYRRAIAIWSAVALVLISGVQTCISEKTWFFVSILATIGPIVFLVHLVVVFAYLSELTNDYNLLTRWCSSFVAVRHLVMIPFLLAVMGLSAVLPGLGDSGSLRRDVGTARISQIIITASTATLFALAFRGGFEERPALREVPPGQTLVTTGFAKLRKTLRMIISDFPALSWFSLAVVFYGAPICSLVAISITFTTGFLNMSARENGVVILAFLLAAISGSKLMPHFARKMGLLTSMKAAVVTWAVMIGVTSAVIRGPDQKDLFNLFSVTWGLLFGWIVPNGRMVYIAIMPKGQESEMMGLFQFFARGFLWLPPLLFTIVNEAGIDMNISILVLASFLILSVLFMQMMGDFDAAVDHAQIMKKDVSCIEKIDQERADSVEI